MKTEITKTKTVHLTGIEIRGEAVLNLWGGGQGSIEIEPYFLPLQHATKDNILRCVNDNGFGCESIEQADIDIYSVYSDRATSFERTLVANSPVHKKLFLGWQHLNTLKGVKNV